MRLLLVPQAARWWAPPIHAEALSRSRAGTYAGVMMELRLYRIAICAWAYLVLASAAWAGGVDSAADPAPPEPGAPVQAETLGPSDSADGAEPCDCGARSPGELAETQRLMQEWQAKQAP
jgi:hypothetical protein